MTMIRLEQKTSPEICGELAARVRRRRRELKLTQAQLAERAGMSLGSYKRFERDHKISLESLVKVALALGNEQDFDVLFSRREYASIEEVIQDAARQGRS